MIRAWVVALFYLIFAFFIECGVKPQVAAALPRGWVGYADLHLLAMAGMIIGLMTDEIEGLGVAVIAAMLLGLAQSPGYLGASLVSFALTAWMAGWLARHFRFQAVIFSAVWLFLLLMVERVIWMLVRWFFFRNSPVEIGMGHLAAMAVAALMGGIVIRIVAPRLKRAMFNSEL